MINLGTKELKSQRLILRKFRLGDFDELFNSYINQDEFLYYANKNKKSIDEVKSMIAIIKDSYANDTYYNWLIVRQEDEKIVGAINLKHVEADTLLISYAIDTRYTKKGYMSEALNRVKSYCFDELEVRKLVGLCCIENISSKRVMEKCGFVLKPTEKKIVLKDGIHDAYEFVIEE